MVLQYYSFYCGMLQQLEVYECTNETFAVQLLQLDELQKQIISINYRSLKNRKKLMVRV